MIIYRAGAHLLWAVQWSYSTFSHRFECTAGSPSSPSVTLPHGAPNSPFYDCRSLLCPQRQTDTGCRTFTQQLCWSQVHERTHPYVWLKPMADRRGSWRTMGEEGVDGDSACSGCVPEKERPLCSVTTEDCGEAMRSSAVHGP